MDVMVTVKRVYSANVLVEGVESREKAMELLESGGDLACEVISEAFDNKDDLVEEFVDGAYDTAGLSRACIMRDTGAVVESREFEDAAL